MTPLDITFEEVQHPQVFAHVQSSDGVLGHAKEFRERIPPGTWLPLQPSLQRLGKFLTAKCGMQYVGTLDVGGELWDFYRRDERP